MNKKTKAILQLMLIAVLFVSFSVVSCNNSGDKPAETPKDTSVSTEKPMEAPAAPATIDTTMKGGDSNAVKIRPTPGGS